jgi:hypothetical protein
VSRDEVREIPVALDQPSVQLLPGLLLRADAAHCLFQPAERLPVPVQVDPELEKERAVLGSEFLPEQFEIVHVVQHGRAARLPTGGKGVIGAGSGGSLPARGDSGSGGGRSPPSRELAK